MPSKPQTNITHLISLCHWEVLEKSHLHLHCISVLWCVRWKCLCLTMHRDCNNEVLTFLEKLLNN